MTLFNIGVALVALVAGGIASIAGFSIGSLLYFPSKAWEIFRMILGKARAGDVTCSPSN